VWTTNNWWIALFGNNTSHLTLSMIWNKDDWLPTPTNRLSQNAAQQSSITHLSTGA
jgi:hypothetical protein